MSNLNWTQTEGGAWEAGPYLVAERVDNKGWNATAYHRDPGMAEDERRAEEILMAATLEQCKAACERHAGNAGLPKAGVLPPGWKIHRREHSIEFQCFFEGGDRTVNFRKDGPLAERIMYKLGMELDTIDYRQEYHDKVESTKHLARELDVALNGEEGAAPAPSLVDVVTQAKGAAKKKGKPLIDKDK